MLRARPLALLAALLVLAPGAASVTAGPRPLRLVVDGRPAPATVHVVAGRAVVPVRSAAGAVGATVHWDGATRTATLRRGDRAVHLTSGRRLARVQTPAGTRLATVEPAPRQSGGTIVAPLRFLLDHLVPGAVIGFDPARGFVSVRMPSRAPREAGAGPLFVLTYYTEEEPPTAAQGAFATLRRFGPRMTAVAGFFSRLQVDSRGNATGDLEWMTTAAAPVRRRVVATARKQGLSTYLLVHNLLYGDTDVSRHVVHQVLTQAGLRKRLIGRIAEVLKAEGYDGVNIDFEGIPPSDRDAYTRFVRELVDALRPAGFEVTLSVAAKVDDSRHNAWAYPYDYRALGRLADRIAIMTYDYHGYVTGPGPIAPLDWVDRVAAYARATMPPERVLLGIAGHGFDWPADGRRPRYLGANAALALAKSVGAGIHADPARGAHFRYKDRSGVGHEVWFETAATLRAKLDVARAHGLGGVALWRAGFEDPAFWSVLAAAQAEAGARPSVASQGGR